MNWHDGLVQTWHFKVPILCFNFKLHEIVVYQGFGTALYVSIRAGIGFPENSPETAWRVLSFRHEPPGDEGWSARRHNHCYAVLVVLSLFGVSMILLWCLYAWMWILRIWLTVHIIGTSEGMTFDLKFWGLGCMLGWWWINIDSAIYEFNYVMVVMQPNQSMYSIRSVKVKLCKYEAVCCVWECYGSLSSTIQSGLWNFPETTWWFIGDRQATHLASPFFWVSWWSAWRRASARLAAAIGFSSSSMFVALWWVAWFG